MRRDRHVRFEEPPDPKSGRWVVLGMETEEVYDLPRKIDIIKSVVDGLPFQLPCHEYIYEEVVLPNGKKQREIVDYVYGKDGQPKEKWGQRIHWDKKLTGFGLCVGCTTMSYIVQRDVDGRTIRRTIGRHGDPWTPAEARAKARKILVKIGEGEDPNVEKRERRELNDRMRRTTLKKVFAEMIEAKQQAQQLKPSTIKQYKQIVNSNLADWMSTPLSKITSEDVLERLQAIRQRALLSKRKHARGDVGDYAMKVLSAVFRFASVKYPFIKDNPVAAIGKAGLWLPDNPRVAVIADKDLSALFRGIDKLREGTLKDDKLVDHNPVGADLIEVMVFTGLRSIEARTLRWENVDFAERSITIPDTKNGKPHKLPIGDHLAGILKRRQEHANGSPWAFPSPRGDGPVFDVIYLAQKVSALSGGPAFLPHTLRKTFSTIAEELLPFSIVVKLMNQAPPGVTLKHYVHPSWDRIRTGMHKINNYLLSHRGGEEEPAVAGRIG